MASISTRRLAICFCIFFVSSAYLHAVSAVHEDCSENTDCKVSDGFTCQDGKCGCDSTKSIYNAVENMCVGLVGSTCTGNFPNELECTEGAVCNSSQMCDCSPHHFQTSENQCSDRKKHLGDECTSHDHCGIDSDSGFNLKCFDNACSCDPETSVVKTERHCSGGFGFREGRVRQMCTILKFCAPKVGDTCGGIKNDICGNNAHCSAGICVCNTGSILAPPTGECFSSHSKPCGPGIKCAESLVCNTDTEICMCRYKEQKVSYGSSHPCRSPYRGSCKQDLDCDELATGCVIEVNKTVGHCGPCQEGLAVSKTGFCLASHGAECETSMDCDDVADLRCLDSKCLCKGQSWYSEPKRKCLKVIGGQCETDVDCIPKAWCDKTDRNMPGQGYCACVYGYSETVEHLCEPDPGTEEDPPKWGWNIPTSVTV